MFVLKKLISPLFFPLSVVLVLAGAGLVLLWFTKRERLGKILVTWGVAVLVLLSTGVTADFLLVPLERRYEPFPTSGDHSVHPTDGDSIRFVVVLGGGHVSDPSLPATSQIGEGTLVRLVEGIRIHRMYPGSRLILSGGAVFDRVPNAEVMATIARQVGIPDESILIESQSRDTRHEAVLLAPIVGSDPFVLVTSAAHMPRSAAMFRAVGTRPIPAPVGHRVKRGGRIRPGRVIPAAGNLLKSTTAFYEYLGLTWAKVRNYL